MFFTNQNYGGIVYFFLNIGKFFNRYLTLMFLMVLGGLYICFKDKNTISIEPLIDYFNKYRISILIFINLVISIIASIYFAKGASDGFKYCQALIGINILVLSIMLFSSLLDVNIASLIIPITLAICSFCVISNFNFEYYKTENLNEYNRMKNDLKEYNASEIYFSMNCTHYLMDMDLWEEENVYFNDGHI